MSGRLIAIAGTGSIGQRHIRSVLVLEPDARFVFLRAGARRDGLSDDLGAQVVDRFAAAVDAGASAMIIATPSALHVDLLYDCLGAGLPVYVEKPVVATRDQLNRVQAAARTVPGPVTQVGCNLRFLPSLQQMRNVITNGDLGPIARADFQAGQWLPDWRPDQDHRASYSADPARGGGVVLDLIHELDAARMLLGEFDSVSAHLARFDPLGIASEAVATCLLRGAGPLVSVSLDYVARAPLRQYRVVGAKATLDWDLGGKQLRLSDGQGVRVLTEDPADFDVPATYPAAMADFLAAVDSGRAAAQPLPEGIASTDLALRIKETAA